MKPPRFFQRTSGSRSCSSARAPAKPRRAAGRWARPSRHRVPRSPGSHSGRPAEGSGAGSHRAARSNWCLPGAQLRPSREQKPPPALELPARGPGRGAGRAQGNRGPETGRPQRTPPNFPALACGVPGGNGACPMGTRARGGGERRATGKLTAVVRLIAVGVRLVLGGLGGRPRGAGAGAGARAGTVGSKELVHILVVVAAAVGGAAGAGAGCGRARGGVQGRGGAGRGSGGQAPREAGEVVGDLFDGPNGPRAHVDGHMLLDADGRLLPAPPEGHAGGAAARGPARPGVTPALGQLSGSRGARRGLRASPARPPDGPDAVAACLAAAGASECGAGSRGRAQPASPGSNQAVSVRAAREGGRAGGRGESEGASERARRATTHSRSHGAHTHTHTRETRKATRSLPSLTLRRPGPACHSFSHEGLQSLFRDMRRCVGHCKHT